MAVPTRGRVLVVGSRVAVVLLAVYSFHAALPPNPLKLPFENRPAVAQTFPQGWGFFTKDPREIRHYDVAAGDPRPPRRTGWLRGDLLFGFDRGERSKGYDIDVVVGLIEAEDLFVPCADGLVVCVRSVAAFTAMGPLFPAGAGLICGRRVIVRESIVPWSWYRQGDVRDEERDLQIAAVDIQC